MLVGYVGVLRESECVGGSKYLMKEEPQQPGAARARNFQAIQWAGAWGEGRMGVPSGSASSG